MPPVGGENLYNRASPVENRQTALRAMEMHPFCRLRRRLPRRGRFALRFPSELCGTLLSIHSAPAFAGWQGNWIRREPLDARESSDTLSRGGRWCRRHQRGESGRRPLIIAMLFLLINKGIQPEPAGSRKLEADSPHLYIQRLLPADWYLIAFLSYAPRTEILRLRLRMTMRAGRQYRNAGSFLRKERGEALRNIESF